MNGVLERTLGILELLAQHGHGLELAAIADQLDIPRSGAHRLLTDHRDLLDQVAERLLDHEAIEREEIVEIMRAHRQRNGEEPATGEFEALGRTEVVAAEPPNDAE